MASDFSTLVENDASSAAHFVDTFDGKEMQSPEGIVSETPHATSSTLPPPYYSGQQTEVAIVMSQPQIMPSAVAVTQENPLSASYFPFSVFTTLFCCFLCGIIALLLSSQSYSDFKAGNREKGKSSARVALLINIVGAALGLVAYMCFLATFFN
ncbi:uncharacterized protein [Oscarella lobularis]|uniref:uncharacterized protein isoform X2 n=1 Tax=Oscarella lobularis TaxID=121494 RepID=UPI00331422C0